MLGKAFAFVVGLALASAAFAQTISREEYQKQLDQRRVEIDAMNRDADPMAWAKAQVDHGIDLYLFDSLDEAIAAYHSALDVYSLEGTPKEWAESQKLLGAAFQKRAAMKGLVGFFVSRTGSSGPDTRADVSDALQAFAAAEQVYTRAEWPAEWLHLQLLEAICHGMHARRDDDAGSVGRQHYEAATANYENVLKYGDVESDVLQRAFAHDGLASLNEHGFVNDSERIRFALEHAKSARVDFFAAGKTEAAERLDQMISGLEYDLERAEGYVPDERDSLFGTKRN
jgi:tetratricopeptide (TPR) repeat protein